MVQASTEKGRNKLTDSDNRYAEFLREDGNYVISMEGVDWYGYSGFLVPAYLPHCCPPISPQAAKQVLSISRRPFVRWHSHLGEPEKSEWWYVLKRGAWSVETIENKKKRWMIRQGRKNFRVRHLDYDEVVRRCPKVALLAAARYKGSVDVESTAILKKRVTAARNVPNVVEYIGCFHDSELVGFSENYIQDNAVWLVNIRHNPSFLDRYSSYALMDWILDEYLNRRKMLYVLDGSRSVHHRTSFQEHLIRVFGFTKEYAVINIIYSRLFGAAVQALYPFRNLVWTLSGKYMTESTDNAAAILKQESIRRSCVSL